VLDGHDADLRPGMSVIPSIQTKAAVATAITPQPAHSHPATSQIASNR
jgi:membrane fusion protein (multidrug efflux system)